MQKTTSIFILLSVLLISCAALFAQPAKPVSDVDKFYTVGVFWGDRKLCDSYIQKGFKINANSDRIVELFLRDLEAALEDLDNQAKWKNLTNDEILKRIASLEEKNIKRIDFLNSYGFKVRKKAALIAKINKYSLYYTLNGVDLELTKLTKRIQEAIPEMK